MSLLKNNCWIGYNAGSIFLGPYSVRVGDYASGTTHLPTNGWAKLQRVSTDSYFKNHGAEAEQGWVGRPCSDVVDDGREEKLTAHRNAVAIRLGGEMRELLREYCYAEAVQLCTQFHREAEVYLDANENGRICRKGGCKPLSRPLGSSSAQGPRGCVGSSVRPYGHRKRQR